MQATPTTSSGKALIELEKKFWQALVDDDTETAVSLLAEPSVMVSSFGPMKFDRGGFRRMAAQAPLVVRSFELHDIDVQFPSEDTAVLTYRVKQIVARRDRSDEMRQEMADASVWVRNGGQWRCALHTESEIDGRMPM